MFVVDGHDGSGKTTAAVRLAQRIGAEYVRPYAGQQGAAFLSSAEARDFERARDIASRAVSMAVDSHRGACAIVFDRHWPTVLSILPAHYLDDWQPFPPTAVLWANLETTLDRVLRRNEAQPSAEWHRHYLERYRELAERYRCHFVRTDRLSEDEVVEDLVEWAERVVVQRTQGECMAPEANT